MNHQHIHSKKKSPQDFTIRIVNVVHPQSLMCRVSYLAPQSSEEQIPGLTTSLSVEEGSHPRKDILIMRDIKPDLIRGCGMEHQSYTPLRSTLPRNRQRSRYVLHLSSCASRFLPPSSPSSHRSLGTDARTAGDRSLHPSLILVLHRQKICLDI
jgi:hypothetical protein